MYGVLPMYQAAREAGIVPIIGTELYQAYEHRSERPVRRNSKVDDSGGEVEGGRRPTTTSPRWRRTRSATAT
jgi:DNA polymerase-3 subunit alpha